MNACHCNMCRRWGGAPMMSVHCGPDVSFEGADKIETFRSSDWAERAFCSVCGTHLYYRFIPVNDHILSVGLFQDGPEFLFLEQIFIDQKPNSYDFSNATSRLTAAEVFAKYAPE
ncbi:MAG TPA: GFA family protein [Steroidobacteraceae bacterium]|nr:GFA family protein [Steroidobacteraceae bacterium]